MAVSRETKYCAAIRSALAQIGHATNAQLLSQLRQSYPDLSATTVHRVTTRLLAGGEIQMAPNTVNGSVRYDANLVPHDHFVCAGCDGVRDIDVASQILPYLVTALGDCKPSGRLAVTGTCAQCDVNLNKGDNYENNNV